MVRKVRTVRTVAFLVGGFCLLGFAIHSVMTFGGVSYEAVTAKLNEVGLEEIAKEADVIFQSPSELPDLAALPPHLAQLKPVKVDVIVDGMILKVVLEEFDGTAETGIYVYRDKNVKKGKYERVRVTSRIGIYKMWD